MYQTIRQPWGLSVFGTGSVQAEPQLARLKLAVDLLAPTADKAFDKAGTAVSALRETLRRHGIPDAKVSGSRLSLKSAYDGYGADRKFLGYRCMATFTIETTNLDALQQLIVDAVNAGANHVDDVLFDVQDKSALRDEARRRAVEAARRKAGSTRRPPMSRWVRWCTSRTWIRSRSRPTAATARMPAARAAATSHRAWWRSRPRCGWASR